MIMRPPLCAGTNSSSARLSYKFQRLREQIRSAITNGEFTGQLPGERELGRRFGANAKTVNKALCDLSSEGLLVRQIGRGTFVAPENGQTAIAGRIHPCLALLSAGVSEAAYRHEMMESLRGALVEKGIVLETEAVARPVDGQIPLSGWPVPARRSTSALICYPVNPLSGGIGYFNDECLMEGWRRHLPTVVLGALGRSAKVSAVAPDYGDAGYRLTEHLLREGCESVFVLVSAAGREAEMVRAGALAAGTRHGKTVTHVVVGEGASPSTCLNGWLASRKARSRKENDGSPVGALCVGASVALAATSDELLMSLVAEDTVRMACVTEPGDASASTYGITSYEVDPNRIAAWAARLVAESRPGQRPLEVLLPGELKLRGPR